MVGVCLIILGVLIMGLALLLLYIGYKEWKEGLICLFPFLWAIGIAFIVLGIYILFAEIKG